MGSSVRPDRIHLCLGIYNQRLPPTECSKRKNMPDVPVFFLTRTTQKVTNKLEMTLPAPESDLFFHIYFLLLLMRPDTRGRDTSTLSKERNDLVGLLPFGTLWVDISFESIHPLDNFGLIEFEGTLVLGIPQEKRNALLFHKLGPKPCFSHVMNEAAEFQLKKSEQKTLLRDPPGKVFQ